MKPGTNITIKVFVDDVRTVEVVTLRDADIQTINPVEEDVVEKSTTPDDGQIFRDWIVDQIVADGIDIHVILKRYLHVDELHDEYEMLLRDLSQKELEAAYNELLCHKEHTYPEYDEMVDMLQKYTVCTVLYRYFYTDAQILEQFEDYLDSLSAPELLEIFHDVVVW